MSIESIIHSLKFKNFKKELSTIKIIGVDEINKSSLFTMSNDIKGSVLNLQKCIGNQIKKESKKSKSYPMLKIISENCGTLLNTAEANSSDKWIQTAANLQKSLADIISSCEDISNNSISKNSEILKDREIKERFKDFGNKLKGLFYQLNEGIDELAEYTNSPFSNVATRKLNSKKTINIMRVSIGK